MTNFSRSTKLWKSWPTKKRSTKSFTTCITEAGATAVEANSTQRLIRFTFISLADPRHPEIAAFIKDENFIVLIERNALAFHDTAVCSSSAATCVCIKLRTLTYKEISATLEFKPSDRLNLIMQLGSANLCTRISAKCKFTPPPVEELSLNVLLFQETTRAPGSTNLSKSPNR